MSKNGCGCIKCRIYDAILTVIDDFASKNPDGKFTAKEFAFASIGMSCAQGALITGLPPCKRGPAFELIAPGDRRSVRLRRKRYLDRR